MLQHLELADWRAELLARLQVVESQAKGFLHATDGLGALPGNGATLLIMQGRQGLADVTEQSATAHKDIIQD
ncbi:hypothetical protein D3C84_1143660 [compost metagenome]